MTAEEYGIAIRAFRSTECPSCGTEKPRTGEPFCTGCSGQLPDNLRDRVHDHKTYLEAFGDAFEHLRKNGTGSFDAGPDEAKA